MVIKNSSDVAVLMNSRLEDICELKGNMRLDCVELFMALYHEMEEIEYWKQKRREARKPGTIVNAKLQLKLLIEQAEVTADSLDLTLDPRTIKILKGAE